ncbi:MAG: bifunctional 4-hydroxy-2-oxoglutarate aldolase/2-dehydro-3-deoxy-phosphogluconate aldolase [Flavitalea sp.]
MDTLSSFFSSKILPAVTFSSSEHALSVAEAILKGGLNIMEVAFRTGAAAQSILEIRKRFPEMIIGAGTLLTSVQLRQAIDAGAVFGLSPGFNPAIADEAVKLDFPFIPGVMTPSEIEIAFASGFPILKLFPAEQVGGISFLKSVLGPYEQLQVQFIPMGGVNPGNMAAFASMGNVIAVGGSWLASKQLIDNKKFDVIESNVREALQRLI